MPKPATPDPDTPVPETPDPDTPDPDTPGPEEIRFEDVKPEDIKSDEDQTKAIARRFGMDTDQFAELNFVKDLSNVTCDCGHGYFKPDKSWVSGADVRAGLAPSKPFNWE